MPGLSRRRFLVRSAAAAAMPLPMDLSFLAPLSRLAAADTRIGPDSARLNSSLERLVKLIRTTPRSRCIPVFVEQLQAGLSYQDYLSALFLSTIEHGDPHQVAGIYAAHRIASEVRAEERLLPLFWALDRITGGFEEKDRQEPPSLTGELPRSDQAREILRESMLKLDPQGAERAVIVLARVRGSRETMSLLWEHGARRVSGTLGHHPIMTASTWRTLEALGWQHAEPVLRYLARSFAQNESDRTYLPNLERSRKTAPALPAGWAATEPNRGATIELFEILRRGETDAACDWICTQLGAGVRAGAVWDAVHLVAADLLFRYRRGTAIPGVLIHAVTSTNALRCGFDCSGDDRVRLLLLLQSAGILGDLFVGTARQDGQLRELHLLDLKVDTARVGRGLADVFAMLPGKANVADEQEPEGGRSRSDEASRLSFSLLQTPDEQTAFKQAARRLLCVKATRNPHDFKYPVAAFEDAAVVSPEWRPHLLAASVHALHGPGSADSVALVEARAALR